MKAMVLDKTDKIENNPLKLKDINFKDPIKKEILVKNISCGVCRSNLHMIEGDWNIYGVPGKLPIIPGHEIIGRVEELGEDVTVLKKGDMVGIQPFRTHCYLLFHCLCYYFFYTRYVYIVIFHILLPPDFKRGISPCYLMIISLLTGVYIYAKYYRQPIILNLYL